MYNYYDPMNQLFLQYIVFFYNLDKLVNFTKPNEKSCIR